jgi:hypothetical protein
MLVCTLIKYVPDTNDVQCISVMKTLFKADLSKSISNNLISHI